MMRRQLDDVRALGEPLAVLTASEPAIYGRFGYGIGSHQLTASIDTARVTLSVPPEADGVRLRFAVPADVQEECEAVYARQVAGRPGMLARGAGWERLPLLDPESGRGGGSPLNCVVAERTAGSSGTRASTPSRSGRTPGPRGSSPCGTWRRWTRGRTRRCGGSCSTST